MPSVGADRPIENKMIIQARKRYVLIASVTKMGQGRLCVGGYEMPEGWSPRAWTPGELLPSPTRSVRLMPETDNAYPESSLLAPGEMIGAELVDRTAITPPHTEDVYVRSSVLVTAQGQPAVFPSMLRQIAIRGHSGPVGALFDGHLLRKPNGRAFMSARALTFSTQWWAPDRAMSEVRAVRRSFDNKMVLQATETATGDLWTFSYVGRKPLCYRLFNQAATNGSLNDASGLLLLRMSLARWWAGKHDEGVVVCYGDLSAAWFAPNDDPGLFVPLICSEEKEGECSHVETEDGGDLPF